MIAKSGCWLQRAMCVAAGFTIWGFGQVLAEGGGQGNSPLAVGAVPTAAEADKAGMAVLPRVLPLAFGSGPQLRMPQAVVAAAAVGPGQPQILAAVPEGPAGGGEMSERPPKSVGRSLLYSAMVPGAGQLYAGSRGRAAFFFVLEVVGWGTYFNWKAKGSDIEDEFRARADTTWSPSRYLTWRTSTIARNSSITHALPCSTFVQAGIAASMSVPESLKGCAGPEVQQYYELIGKYDQFVAGWNDIQDSTGTKFKDLLKVDNPADVTSPHRDAYEIRRDDSNKYLKRATNIAGLILVNHVFSAIDAARAARATANGADKASLQRRMRFAFFRGGGSGKTPMIVAYKPIH